MLSSSRVRVAVAFGCIMACAALIGQAWSQQAQDEQPAARAGQAPSTQPGPMSEMCKMHMDMMTKLKDTLAQAKQAVQAGNTEQASQKIDQAQQLIDKQHAAMHERMQGRMGRMMSRMGDGGGMKCPMCGQAMGPAGEDKVANSQCPMDGSKIDPSKMTKGSTRDYKGEKLGFCCAGCANQWDQLSDAQKKDKMDALAAKTPGDAGQGVGQR